MDASKNIIPIKRERPGFWKTAFDVVLNNSNTKKKEKKIKGLRETLRAEKNSK